MLTVWVSPPTILVISLGFAGLLGEQIRQLRSRLNQNKGHFPRFGRIEALLRSNKHQLAAALALVGLVLLPPLSLPPAIQWFCWVAASLVIVLFTVRPKTFPAKIFSCRFAWQYASFVMLVAALWNFLAGPGLPFLLLSLAALAASLLTWKRSLEPPA